MRSPRLARECLRRKPEPRLKRQAIASPHVVSFRALWSFLQVAQLSTLLWLSSARLPENIHFLHSEMISPATK
jgi:hypothetical protein